MPGVRPRGTWRYTATDLSVAFARRRARTENPHTTALAVQQTSPMVRVNRMYDYTRII